MNYARIQPDYDARTLARTRRRRVVDEAADALRKQMERQDACGYRDWPDLIEAIVADVDVSELRKL